MESDNDVLTAKRAAAMFAKAKAKSEAQALELVDASEDEPRDHVPLWSQRHDAYCGHSRRRVFVSLKGETVLENFFGGRFNNPVDWLRPVVKAYLLGRGIPVKGMVWSQKAGCSCPCSPGFVVAQAGPNIHLTYKVKGGA
jgi:hypothetical protein